MPKFGLTMTEGTLVHWLAAEGQHVERGRPIAEIETEKIVNELPAPADGTLVWLTLKEGGSACVSDVIGWILLEGESEVDVPATDPAAGPKTRKPHSPAEPASVRSPAVERAPSSPSARRLAAELGVDLNTVTGTGPGGRITNDDVQMAANQHESQASTRSIADCELRTADSRTERAVPHRVEPLSAMRAAIVKTVTESAGVPQVTLFSRADASVLKTMRERAGDFAYDDAIIYCVARALACTTALGWPVVPPLNSQIAGSSARDG
jgi:pyruvate dehydrogenase E2 component (dihydrolipoamide acetyltransferase)